MSNPLESYELAKEHLMTKNVQELLQFIDEDQNLAVFTNYYQALNDIEIKCLNRTIELTPEQKEYLDTNKRHLLQLRNEIAKKDLSDSLKMYPITLVFASLVSSIRDMECNVDKYGEYTEIVKKFREMEPHLVNAADLQSYWKNVDESIDELHFFLENKTKIFFPTINKIILEMISARGKDIDNARIVIGNLREMHKEKECFYLLANLLQTNPLLQRKVKNFCSSKNEDYKVFEPFFIQAAFIFKEETQEPKIKRLWELFLNQEKFRK